MTDSKLIRPLTVIHEFAKQNNRVSVWLEGDNHLRFDGILRGYDEFMNIVLEDAAEVHVKEKKRLQIGKIVLKGDTIALIHSIDA